MKLLFYMGHPAHFHLYKETIKSLQFKGVECFVLIKSKDVLEDLLQSSGLSYINVFNVLRISNISGKFYQDARERATRPAATRYVL